MKKAILGAIKKYANDNNNQEFEIKKEYLPKIKGIYVDRKGVLNYHQGGGDDELVVNCNNRKLTRLKFYKKHQSHPKKQDAKNVYNMVMVAEYEENNNNDDKKPARKQYCIIDMDNNLLISNNQLRLYWHHMDDFKNNGFDDEEYKVYISGTKYHSFRINNRLQSEKDEKAFKKAQKFILYNGGKLYGIEQLKKITAKKIFEELTEALESCPVGTYFEWTKELDKKIKHYINSIKKADNVNILYKIYLDIQKDLLSSSNKNSLFKNNIGKNIKDEIIKNSQATEYISVNEDRFKEIIVDNAKMFKFDHNEIKKGKNNVEIFNVKITDLISFILLKANGLCTALSNKIDELNNHDLVSKTNNGETTTPLNAKNTKLEGKEDNVINNNTATTCGCFKGFSLCG